MCTVTNIALSTGIWHEQLYMGGFMEGLHFFKSCTHDFALYLQPQPIFTCPEISQALKLLPQELMALGMVMETDKAQEVGTRLSSSSCLLSSSRQAWHKVDKRSWLSGLLWTSSLSRQCHTLLSDLGYKWYSHSHCTTFSTSYFPSQCSEGPAVNAKHLDEPG